MAYSEAPGPSRKGFFSNLFGQATVGENAPPESVLSEWNKYSGQTGKQWPVCAKSEQSHLFFTDIRQEDCSADGGHSDNFLNQMEEGSASMQHFLSTSVSRVTSGVQGLSTGVNSQMPRSATYVTHTSQKGLEGNAKGNCAAANLKVDETG